MEDAADCLLDGLHIVGPEEILLRSVMAAAAWWVGFYAIIRHQGVHHLTMQPVESAIEVGILESAARVVALGVATRTLTAWLRGAGLEKAAVRALYCRAVTEGIIIEREIPALLDALGELRLVDLTTLFIPWRGRFTKYKSGAGAGQVE